MGPWDSPAKGCRPLAGTSPDESRAILSVALGLEPWQPRRWSVTLAWEQPTSYTCALQCLTALSVRYLSRMM